jgi:hypothetical protein
MSLDEVRALVAQLLKEFGLPVEDDDPPAQASEEPRQQKR